MSEDGDWQPPSEEEMKLIQARRERSDKISKLMSGYLLKGYKMLGTVCADCDTILLQDRQGTKYCVACSELASDTEKDNPVSSKAPEKSGAASSQPPSCPPTASSLESRGLSKGFTSAAPLTPRFKTRNSGNYSAIDAIPEFAGGDRDENAQTLSMSSIDVQCWPSNPNGINVDPQTTNPKQDLETPASSHLRSPPATEEFQSAKPKTSSPQSSSVVPLNSQPQMLLSTVHPAVPASIAALWEKVDWASKELKQCQSLECSIQLCNLIKSAADAVDALKKANR